ncbi:MAG: methyltransferase domain-containing protein [Erysipelotrichales bacterium]|nr:methyltransferase domain-containing protein [Erysipelotrichales bacterium]
MDHFRTQYEKCYDQEEYYWGLEPASFLQGLLDMTGKDPKDLKVLDMGCGEGKDAVYMAEKGCQVSAFDITGSGIRKTKLLAANRGVDINAFVADINDLHVEDKFDIIYSTGTIQYLFDDKIEPFFHQLKSMVHEGGYVYLNVFVDKPFLPLPPDWDKEEKMWKTGQLFTYFADWEICDMKEVIFECNSSGIKHYHCMDTVIAKYRV